MCRWLLLVWFAFLVFATVFAPSQLETDILEMSKRLTLFDWHNPALCGLWYATGTVLFGHATFYFAERSQHRPHPMLVLMLSPIFGALLMLPYYALRQVDPTRAPWSLPWRLLRYILVVEFVGFVLYGVIAGDLAELWYEITHRRFSSFLVIDFVLLLALLPFARSSTIASTSDRPSLSSRSS
jgi:hypothetical protein